MSTQNFEKSLGTLENLVTQMEKGDLPLEQSLKLFEQGVGIIRECQQALTSAEQKVEILLQQQNSEPQLKPFDAQNTEQAD